MSESTKKNADPHFKRIGREIAMQYLFQTDLGGNVETADLPGEAEDRPLFWEQMTSVHEVADPRSFRKAKNYAERMIAGVSENMAKIDEKIMDHSEKWDLNRMSTVDRNVLRIAVYEMLFVPEVPPVVSINEAVGVARDFGGENSGKFINGVLNALKDTLSRPARKAVKAI